MTYKEKETVLQELNERWPDFIEGELRAFDYLLGLSEEVVKLLKEMRFVDVCWLENPYESPFSDMNLTVCHEKTEYWFTGALQSPETKSYITASVDLIQTNEEVMTELEGAQLLSQLFTNGGLRDVLMKVDGNRYQPVELY